MAAKQPIGLVGGSGLLRCGLPFLEGAHLKEVETSHGRVQLRVADNAGQKVVFVQRHDADPVQEYSQPGDINYAAIALALQSEGCKRAVGVCSVGSLRLHIPVASFVVPSDYYCPFDVRRIFTSGKAHFVPGIDEELRLCIRDSIREAHMVTDGGVYVNSMGPRFETVAEIRAFQTLGGDILGMTGAHEAAACQEAGIKYAMLALVDNMCNGLGEQVTLEEFFRQQKENEPKLEAAVEAVVTAVAKLPPIAEEEAAAGAGDAGAAMEDEEATPAAVEPAAGKKQTVDLMVHAGYIVPVEPDPTAVLKHHCIVVRDGVIVAVMPSTSARELYRAEQEVDLPHHCLMPGLVNCHAHLPMNHLRGYADDLPLMQWLTTQIWPAEGKHMSREFVRSGTRLALAELIRGGTTLVNDMYFFPDEVATEVRAAGIRARVGACVMEFPSAYAKDAPDYLQKAEDTAAELRAIPKGSPATEVEGGWAQRPMSALVDMSVAPHAPYTVNDEHLVDCQKLAAKLGVPVHIHLHETPAECELSAAGKDGPNRHLSQEKCRPVANFKRLGLLNDRLIAVHMTQLTDEEITDVAAANTSVVHCPASNLKLASGFCPVAKLLAAGVNVAIGTDGAASNNTLDLLGEMRLAALLAKGVSMEATAVPACAALQMATINGARAMHLDHITGSLLPGKSADFIAFRLDQLEQLPVYDIISHLVYAADRDRVTDVWVYGRRLMRQRTLLTINEPAAKALARQWMLRIKPEMAETVVDGEEHSAGAAAAAGSAADE